MKGIKRFKPILLTAGVAGSLFAYSQVHKINGKLEYIKTNLDKNGKEPLLELTSMNSTVFPWEFSPDSIESENWEFRRVKVKGGLFATRHLIRRDKGDRPGYLVFAGMPTSQHVVKELNIPVFTEETVGAQNGIIVCLGWIPLEATHRILGSGMLQNEVVLNDDIYKDSKNIIAGRYKDPFTGFIYNKAVAKDERLPIDEPYDDSLNPDLRKARYVLGEALNPTTEDPDGIKPMRELGPDSEMSYWGESNLPTYEGLYHIKGYLRKGEKSDWLLGRVNKGIRNVNKIDVTKIAGFYRFRNPSAYEYYLDRCTENDEEYESMLPQPNNLNKPFEHLEPFEKDAYYDGYNRMMKWAGVITVLGLLI